MPAYWRTNKGTKGCGPTGRAPKIVGRPRHYHVAKNRPRKGETHAHVLSRTHLSLLDQGRLALAEKRVPFDSKPMTRRGDQFDPAYMKLNPNAVVPTIIHDTFQTAVDDGVSRRSDALCQPARPVTQGAEDLPCGVRDATLI
jgi:hypothetical protein